MKSNAVKISCKRGFTLIELLVVVLIIGILTAVAVPQYKIAVAKSRFSTLKHLTDALAKAEEVYYLANGKYTEVIAQLDVDLPGDKDEEKSSDKTYVYDWGSCSVKVEGQAYCTHKAIRMQYQIWLAHHAAPNRRACVVLDTTDLTDWRNKICKAEIGTSGSNGSGSYVIWASQ